MVTPCHLEQVRDTDSPGEDSSGSDEQSKRKSWSVVEEKCLIAAYKELHAALKSTKSSHEKKTIWERILKKFQQMCLESAAETDKSLTQLKEKWRALFDKYKTVCDNNNRIGRERKTFKHYNDIDEFMATSDKVNPRFIKETNVLKDDDLDDTDASFSTGDQKTDGEMQSVKRPAATCGETVREKEKEGQKKKKKRQSSDSTEQEILDLMKTQQESLQRCEESDQKVFEALLKSQAEAQRQHQEFIISVLGKLGDIFVSKK